VAILALFLEISKAKAVLQLTGMPVLEGPFPVKVEPKQD